MAVALSPHHSTNHAPGQIEFSRNSGSRHRKTTGHFYKYANHNTIISALLLCVVLAIHVPAIQAFEYVLSPPLSSRDFVIRVVDIVTNTSDNPTMFVHENVTVHVDNLLWQSSPVASTDNSTVLSTARLSYTTYFNGMEVAIGSHDLSKPGSLPPSSVSAGSLTVDKSGRHNLTVALQITYDSNDNSNTDSPVISTSRHYQAYWVWVTMVPIGVLSLMAWLTGNVEITISFTNFVSVCIAHGHVLRGMRHLVEGCILQALTNYFNGAVMLLVFFLSGIMSLAHVTGGTKGFLRFVARFVRSTRVVQCLLYGLGVCFFNDDVLSILLLGHLTRPLMDMAHSSRPLMAMILDATAGPISSVVLLSTWLVWEIPLLQQELARIESLEDTPFLDMTAFEVLKESLQYAFYPILMLVLMPMLLWSQRHAGPMLLCERLTQVYQSRDGGISATKGPCQPHLPVPPERPRRGWNAFIPFALITTLFWVFWWQTGREGARENATYNGIDDGAEAIPSIFGYSNVQKAWLQSISMGAALFVFSLLMQLQKGDSIVFLLLNIRALRAQKRRIAAQAQQQKLLSIRGDCDEEKNLLNSNQNSSLEKVVDDRNTTTLTAASAPRNGGELDDEFESDQPSLQPLIPLMDLIKSFFFGFSHVMPFMIQFILAWALRQSMVEMGWSRWIATMLGVYLEKLDTALIPAASFVAAFVMSIVTGGAPRGTVASILLPLTITPVYDITHTTKPETVFKVIGAILSGCVAGDHAAPLSNSTLLSCLSSDCHLMYHVVTQIPYIMVAMILSLIFGTLATGFDLYPTGVGHFIGIIGIVFFVFFLCYPVLDQGGQWDLLMRVYIKRQLRRQKTKDETGMEDFGDAYDELDETYRGNTFWEILQRDTVRAAIGTSEGVPYETEDCRKLMEGGGNTEVKMESDSDEVIEDTTSSHSGNEDEQYLEDVDNQERVPAHGRKIARNSVYELQSTKEGKVC